MFYCVMLLALIEYKKAANESSELDFCFKKDIIFNTTSERSNKPTGGQYKSLELQQQRKNNNRRVYLDILLVRVKVLLLPVWFVKPCASQSLRKYWCSPNLHHESFDLRREIISSSVSVIKKTNTVLVLTHAGVYESPPGLQNVSESDSFTKAEPFNWRRGPLRMWIELYQPFVAPDWAEEVW